MELSTPPQLSSASNTWLAPLYSPLKHASSFRLLEVAPKSRNGLIVTTLHEVEISNAAHYGYEAVSYSWGSAALDHTIVCNESICFITQNCYEAIEQLQCVNRPRFLWIDSLCINQGSILERNNQVRLMGDIYKNATRVLVWLGKSDEWSSAGFRFLSEFGTRLDAMRDAEEETDLERELGRVAEEEEPEFDENHTYIDKDTRILRAFVKSIFADVNIPNDGYSLCGEQLGEDSSLTGTMPIGAKVLQKLLQRPWFDRMWTVQEVVLAKDCLVICGNDSIGWDQFIRPLRLVECLPEYTGLSPYLVGHLFPHAVVHPTERESFNSELNWEAVPQALAVLVSCREKDCRDLRDKVFSLSGLFKALNLKIEDPDYGKSIRDVYIDTAQFVLATDRSSSLLLHASRLPHSQPSQFSHALPSWVPDWSCRDFNSYLRSHSNDPYLVSGEIWELFDVAAPPFEATKSSRLTDFHITDDGTVLSLYGHRIDTIRSVFYFPSIEEDLATASLHDATFGESATLDDASEEERAFLRLNWDFLVPFLRKCIDFTNNDLINDIQPLPIAAEDRSAGTGASVHPLVTLCNDLLTLDLDTDCLQWHLDHFVERLGNPDSEASAYAVYRLDCEDGVPFAMRDIFDILPSTCDSEGEDTSPDSPNLSYSSSSSLSSLSSSPSMSPSSTSSSSSTIRPPIQDQHVHTAARIFNDTASKEFFQALLWSLEGRYVYFTSSGRIGVARAPVKNSDTVFLLEGLDVPVILRETLGLCYSEPRYSVVGPTYLADVMYGESWSEESMEKVNLV